MTQNEARSKIRNHLKRDGKKFLIVTERIVRYWWCICNKALFRGKLTPPDRIIIKQFKDHYGYCEADNQTVTIGIHSDIGTRELFLTTLVHEMVHQWEYYVGHRMGHGKRFYAWQGRIKKHLGLDLDTEINEEDYFTYGEKQLFKRRHKITE